MSLSNILFVAFFEGKTLFESGFISDKLNEIALFKLISK